MIYVRLEMFISAHGAVGWFHGEFWHGFSGNAVFFWSGFFLFAGGKAQTGVVVEILCLDLQLVGHKSHGQIVVADTVCYQLIFSAVVVHYCGNFFHFFLEFGEPEWAV